MGRYCTSFWSFCHFITCLLVKILITFQFLTMDTLVAGVVHATPQASLNLVRRATRVRGLRLQRERIRNSMIRVDPITSTLRNSRRVVRRTYNVPCLNALW